MAQASRQSRSAKLSAFIAGSVALALVSVPAHAATIPSPPTNTTACTPAPHDYGVPEMVSIARTPTVDVRRHSKAVVFTIRASDDAVDIAHVTLQVQSPVVHSRFRARSVVLHRVSGTARDGTWKGQVALPTWTIPGHWTITLVEVSEAVFEDVDAGQGSSPLGVARYSPYGDRDDNRTQLFKHAWPSTFTVKSKPDLAAPTITSFTLSRRSVNTASSSQSIRVTVTAKDAMTGINEITAGAYRPYDLIPRVSLGGVLDRTKGNSRTGTFTGLVVLPKGTGSGTATWWLRLSSRDRAGNVSVLKGAALKAKHLPSTIKVTSSTDTKPPVLKAFTLQASVDTTGGDKTVPVAVTAVDTGSVVSQAVVLLSLPSGQMGEARLHQRSDGSWVGSVAVPQCTQPGEWSAKVYLLDREGNAVTLTPAALSARGFPSMLNVHALDWVPPVASVPQHATTTDVDLAFSEPTLWAGATNPLTVTQFGSGTPVSGTWACRQANGTSVGCNDDGADVAKASFAPDIPFVAGQSYVISSSASTIYDTAGNGPLEVDAYFTAH